VIVERFILEKGRKECCYVRTKRLHINRALGGNSHYCAAYVHIDAGFGEGQEDDKGGYVCVEL
jgi:hypothetical protein